MDKLQFLVLIFAVLLSKLCVMCHCVITKYIKAVYRFARWRQPLSGEWWGAGVVICLERGAELHTAQLMPLPLTVSCFSKIQIGFTFLVPAHLGSPRKGPLNGCV